MPPPAVRRVVTGHNDAGLAIVALDEVVQGSVVTQVWGTDKPLSDNVSDWAYGSSQPGPHMPAGSALRFVDINPGYRSAMHRTSSIDYVFILDGELEMELDGGEWVQLKAGDIVIQRGTNHAWENKSDRVCRLASVLVTAEPVLFNGKPLEATLR
jgi:mannose-6-phosphate isomerase-like protein (cupin superfamily)